MPRGLRQVDQFTFKLPDLGTLFKVRIGHDNDKTGSGWYLSKVVVRAMDRATVFPADRWFSKGEDDGLTVRELPAAAAPDHAGIALGMKKYIVTVATGDVMNAGTNANVFITLFGHNGDSVHALAFMWARACAWRSRSLG